MVKTSTEVMTTKLAIVGELDEALRNLLRMVVPKARLPRQHDLGATLEVPGETSYPEWISEHYTGLFTI